MHMWKIKGNTKKDYYRIQKEGENMEKKVLHKFCQKIKNYSFSIDYWDGSSEVYIVQD